MIGIQHKYENNVIRNKTRKTNDASRAGCRNCQTINFLQLQLAQKLARGEISQEVYLQAISSLKTYGQTEGVSIAKSTIIIFDQEMKNLIKYLYSK